MLKQKLGITRIFGRVEEVTADRLRLQCQRSKKNGNLQAAHIFDLFHIFLLFDIFEGFSCWLEVWRIGEEAGSFDQKRE